MPALKERQTSPVAWAVLAILGGAYLYGLWIKPLLLGGVALVVVTIAVIDHFKTQRHLRRLAAERSGESLCTFARSFQVRATDTWVIRAVYELLQEHLKGEHPSFPLRASDRLAEDLQLDPDDLDFDIAADIAARTGRSLTNTRENPYYGNVTTVADLVQFFCAQARKAGEQLDAADEARASSAGWRGPRS